MLTNHGISSVYHYAPLHYLVFILRTSALMSKVVLQAHGFSDSHFRSTSKKQDIDRGFENYIHMTLEECPRILQAKLRGGFPHFEITLPASEVELIEHHLCRFNIAKARYFKGAKQMPEESSKNGFYYGDMALPIAVQDNERRQLLEKNLGKNMIEVLVPNQLTLPKDSYLSFFSQEDLDIATEIAATLSNVCDMRLIDKTVEYNRNERYTQKVKEYLNKSLADHSWMGDGLEFDRV